MQDVALDACCLINLCAAGKILCLPSPSIAKSRNTQSARHSLGFGLRLHAPAKVTSEALYILKCDEENETALVRCPIDLQPYVMAGLLAPCDCETPEEIELFVQMAAQLGDGEAACFALAAKRGWAMATDDRRACRLATEANLTVITTPELVKCWAKKTHASGKDTATVLQNIQRFAYFTPRLNAPEYAWWMSSLLP
jgi:hypothetical protein